MKVIVAGFSKTGTKSMNSALTTLGFKVYDIDHHLFCHGKEWKKIITESGSKEDFYQMYKDVDAVVDLPAFAFWEEILEAFPDAKIIFTAREEESWLRSWVKQNKEVENNLSLTISCLLTATGRRVRKLSELIGCSLLGFSSFTFLTMKRHLNETLMRKFYRAHNAAVLMRAPKSQLLTFDIKDGWKPLCKFLGKPIPNVTFPHRNKNSGIVDDYMQNNPLFLQIQYEAKLTLAIIVVVFAVFVWSLVD